MTAKDVKEITYALGNFLYRFRATGENRKGGGLLLDEG